MIVGANVEHDRKRAFRGHAGAGCVEGQFADRNAHAADAQVAKPQYPFAIGRHDEADVIDRPVGNQLSKATGCRYREVKSARGPENVIELLAGLTDGRRVDDRHQRRRIGHDNRVEQGFITRLKVRQDQVFLQIVAHARKLAVDARDLMLQCAGDWRQAARAGRDNLLT